MITMKPASKALILKVLGDHHDELLNDYEKSKRENNDTKRAKVLNQIIHLEQAIEDVKALP